MSSNWHQFSAGRRLVAAITLWVACACLLPSVARAQDAQLAVAVLNLEAEGVDAQMTDTLTSIVRNEALQVPKYEIVNKSPLNFRDVLLVLDCDPNSTACLRRAAEQLNTRVLVYGAVAKSNDGFRIELNIFDASYGRLVNRLVRTIDDTSDPVIAFRKEIEAFFAEERGLATTRLEIGSSVRGAKIRIDDTVVGVVPLERKGLPPGKYVVEVVADGYQVWRSEIELVEGEEESVWAQLTPLAPDEEVVRDVVVVTPVPRDSARAEPAATVEPPVPPREANWGAWSGVFAGGATIGAAIVVGILMESTEDQLEQEAIEGNLTVERYDELFRRGERQETAHRVLLGVGGAILTGGVLWLLLDDGSDAQASVGVTPGGLLARVRW